MAMTMTTARPTTADELLAMPDDGFRYELVRGELRRTSPAGHSHGEYAMSIGVSLGAHVRANRLGKTYAAETGFLLESDPDHVRAPDVAFVRGERADAARNTRGYFPGPPDLAVEVVSPHDRRAAVDEKIADWLAAGVLAVVVVNPPDRTVKIHRPPAGVVTLTADDVLEVDDVVPGWRMPVRGMFE